MELLNLSKVKSKIPTILENFTYKSSNLDEGGSNSLYSNQDDQKMEDEDDPNSFYQEQKINKSHKKKYFIIYKTSILSISLDNQQDSQRCSRKPLLETERKQRPYFHRYLEKDSMLLYSDKTRPTNLLAMAKNVVVVNFRMKRYFIHELNYMNIMIRSLKSSFEKIQS